MSESVRYVLLDSNTREPITRVHQDDEETPVASDTLWELVAIAAECEDTSTIVYLEMLREREIQHVIVREHYSHHELTAEDRAELERMVRG